MARIRVSKTKAGDSAQWVEPRPRLPNPGSPLRALQRKRAASFLRKRASELLPRNVRDGRSERPGSDGLFSPGRYFQAFAEVDEPGAGAKVKLRDWVLRWFARTQGGSQESPAQLNPLAGFRKASGFLFPSSNFPCLLEPLERYATGKEMVKVVPF